MNQLNPGQKAERKLFRFLQLLSFHPETKGTDFCFRLEAHLQSDSEADVQSEAEQDLSESERDLQSEPDL